MAKNRVKVIINPVADFGHAWQGAAELRQVAQEVGALDIDWENTQAPKQAADLARQAGEQGFELVVAVGGDGTTHEVINGIMQLPGGQRPEVGIVPMGSGNDFAYAVGMAPHPSDAFRQVLTGTARGMDIGRLELQDGRCEYFTNAVGIGFDATVTNYFKEVKHLRGVSAYLLSIIKTIVLHHEARHMQVETDEEKWVEDTLMLVVCNGSREGGGFLVAPQSEPDDGVFHYARVCSVSRLMMFRLLPEVMNGTHERFPQVTLGQFRRMALESDKPLHIHTDGEILASFDSTVASLSVQILPGEIEVVT